ncbi:hypothetical protein PVAG01_08622 [Phlyctema vagabunda]|uniref:Uncharacterized protein n=1 Tax=Phlyctema vagabunda TaxID=108571 RepID=A0ABR4P9X4_9HELO
MVLPPKKLYWELQTHQRLYMNGASNKIHVFSRTDEELKQSVRKLRTLTACFCSQSQHCGAQELHESSNALWPNHAGNAMEMTRTMNAAAKGTERFLNDDEDNKEDEDHDTGRDRSSS